MAVEFEDNRVTVKNLLGENAVRFLYEAAGEIKAQTVRNSRPSEPGKHDVRGNWSYQVNEGKLEAIVGNPLEASYWEEFGTGQYALHGDGRKGWWVYVEGNDTPRENQHYYTEKEAKAVAASMRRQGLDAHATNGTAPNRPLFRAFNEHKGDIIRLAEHYLGEGME